MSVMSELNATITLWLEQGHNPEHIADLLEVPLEWVQVIESQLVEAADAGEYDDIDDRYCYG